ncbi:MAG TPA: Asp-tRNA(Asn)/Glu-tRNA(Gln) amidotransferase subunit GatC [Opitutaceae bacterium]|nr:Asp-tRNA(Asn)/Glu-tRNA(Gln) amidotransferase subunit GatC [Opitutaceae bacterium]
MSSEPNINIEHIATLARIALTDDEKRIFASQLGDVLAYIEKLREVDVSGVEPMAHAFPVFNVWMEDVSGPALPVEAVLRNAPASRDNMISVPKVVE